MAYGRQSSQEDIETYEGISGNPVEMALVRIAGLPLLRQRVELELVLQQTLVEWEKATRWWLAELETGSLPAVDLRIPAASKVLKLQERLAQVGIALRDRHRSGD